MGDKLDVIINKNFHNLNDIDLHILKFVKNNILIASDISIKNLANICNVSSATILRTSKKLGFDGFSDFKYFIKRELSHKTKSNHTNFLHTLNDDTIQTIKLFVQNENKHEIYNLMQRCSNIYAFSNGYGQSIMLKEFSRCLLNVGIHLIVLSSITEFEIIANSIHKDSLIFIASNSGNMNHFDTIVNNLSLKGIPLVSITNLKTNKLSSSSPFNLYFQDSNIDNNTNLNNGSFLMLHLVIHLLYEGYKNYLA